MVGVIHWKFLQNGQSNSATESRFASDCSCRAASWMLPQARSLTPSQVLICRSSGGNRPRICCRDCQKRLKRWCDGLFLPCGASVASRIEQQVDYLAAVIADPTSRHTGAEMWRVGLIPDFGGEGCVDRLERNLKCVRELVRPARAHTSAAERLNICELCDGPVKSELLAYLGNKSLRDARAWLKGMTEDPFRERITFEKWAFVQGQESNLEQIDVVPLLDEAGIVRANTGFHQSEPGTQPVAPLGPKNKIKIKWECAPKNAV